MHQITLEELGLIPRQIDRRIYACACGKCTCSHCTNNVDCMESKAEEMEFPCFNCDECLNYNGDTGIDNWKSHCSKYRVTDAYAKRARNRLKIVKG